MHFLRTTLAAALVGVSLSSFAAMPPADTAAAREARMQEALENFRAKQQAVAGNTTPSKASKRSKNAKRTAKDSGKTQ
jgi:hypothetical protein